LKVWRTWGNQLGGRQGQVQIKRKQNNQTTTFVPSTCYPFDYSSQFTTRCNWSYFWCSKGWAFKCISSCCLMFEHVMTHECFCP
jgi:hypothetical protein